jgi:exodeoxyribonuclease VII large subunit
VLADLRASLADYERRLITCGERALEHRRTRLAAAARGLPRPQDLLALATQRLDIASGRLGAGLHRNVAAHAHAFAGPAASLKPALLRRPLELKGARLAEFGARLAPLMSRRLARETERVETQEKLLFSFSPKGPLLRGYAFVHRENGRLARSAGQLDGGEAVQLEFYDGKRGAVVDAPPARRAARAKPARAASTQGDLF